MFTTTNIIIIVASGIIGGVLGPMLVKVIVRNKKKN